MAQPGARRPPPPTSGTPGLTHRLHADLQTSSLVQQHKQNAAAGPKGAGVEALALAAGVKPNYRGHQRRQSVARLLPDISKLRLLSWLVEASNELINCDIAIMDGVYAKLNRSRESLLFWQQSREQQQQQQQQQRQHSAGRAPPRPPPPQPPRMAPVDGKAVISKQRASSSSSAATTTSSPALGFKQQRHLQASGRSKASSVIAALPQAASHRSHNHHHHSLPLANYDAASLAALSIRSSNTIPQSTPRCATSDAISDLEPAGTRSRLPSASSVAAQQQQQNLRQPRGQPSVAQQRPPPPRRQNNATAQGTEKANSLALLAAASDTSGPGAVAPGPDDYCDTSNQSDDEREPEEGAENEEDDDDHSSAVSSTSSGIHETSSSSSSAASTASHSSSSASSSCSASDSSCSLDEPPASVAQAAGAANAPPPTAASSAEQLSERIRRAVMEHNYLQNLLVNVIRQHDRHRELLERQRRHQMILMRQQRSDQFGRSLNNQPSCGLLELPRIDLADIADALDDGCQCACHSASLAAPGGSRHHSVCGNSPASTLSVGSAAAAAAASRAASRASTLPTSSSLSLSSAASTVLAAPSRKNRRKKNNHEPSREDIIARLADKLCEGCFETHYWLYSCHSQAADLLTPLQEHQHQQQTDAAAGALATTSSTGDLKAAGQKQSLASGGGGGGGGGASSKEQLANLDAIISLRNATFIRLVQQQVRSTISNSIELIDLIRREIKSPESIKQKQLMRCFSASIQLLSSVAGYVVPSQDISTFINADVVAGGGGGPSSGGGATGGGGGGGLGNSSQRLHGQQPTALFNLPPSDFDHLLLQAALAPAQHYPYGATTAPGQPPKSNYHLAQAPEIPVRRRVNSLQRRSSDEGGSCGISRASNNNTSNPDAEALRSLPPNTSLRHKGSSEDIRNTSTNPNGANSGTESSSGASSNNSSASSSIARNQAQQHPSLTKAHTSSAILDGKTSHDLSFEAMARLSHQRQQAEDDLSGLGGQRAKFWQSSKFNFIKKLLQVKQQRLLRQQSKDRRIYNNKVANKFRLVMMDLTHFNRSQQLLATENGVNSLLTSMRNVLEFGLYLTVKLY